jgi:hypothetical protein
MPGLSLHATVHIKPEDVPQFMEQARYIFDKVVSEPECVFFELYQSPEDPGTFSWVENWSVKQCNFLQFYWHPRRLTDSEQELHSGMVHGSMSRHLLSPARDNVKSGPLSLIRS